MDRVRSNQKSGGQSYNHTPPPTLPSVILHQPHGSLSLSNADCVHSRRDPEVHMLKQCRSWRACQSTPSKSFFFFSLSLSLSLSLVYSNWLPRTDLERLLHAEPGMKITRPQKSSALQSFSLSATYHFSVMSNGLMTSRQLRTSGQF